MSRLVDENDGDTDIHVHMLVYYKISIAVLLSIAFFSLIGIVLDAILSYSKGKRKKDSSMSEDNGGSPESEKLIRKEVNLVSYLIGRVVAVSTAIVMGALLLYITTNGKLSSSFSALLFSGCNASTRVIWRSVLLYYLQKTDTGQDHFVWGNNWLSICLQATFFAAKFIEVYAVSLFGSSSMNSNHYAYNAMRVGSLLALASDVLLLTCFFTWIASRIGSLPGCAHLDRTASSGWLRGIRTLISGRRKAGGRSSRTGELKSAKSVSTSVSKRVSRLREKDIFCLALMTCYSIVWAVDLAISVTYDGWVYSGKKAAAALSLPGVFRSWQYTTAEVYIAVFFLVVLTVLPEVFVRSEWAFLEERIKAARLRYLRYISHELRTPMNTMYLGLNHLEELLDEEEERLLQEHHLQLQRQQRDEQQQQEKEVWNKVDPPPPSSLMRDTPPLPSSLLRSTPPLPEGLTDADEKAAEEEDQDQDSKEEYGIFVERQGTHMEEYFSPATRTTAQWQDETLNAQQNYRVSNGGKGVQIDIREIYERLEYRRELITDVLSACEASLNVLNNLLSYDNLSSSPEERVAPRREEVNAETFLVECLRPCRLQAESLGIEFNAAVGLSTYPVDISSTPAPLSIPLVPLGDNMSFKASSLPEENGRLSMVTPSSINGAGHGRGDSSSCFKRSPDALAAAAASTTSNNDAAVNMVSGTEVMIGGLRQQNALAFPASSLLPPSPTTAAVLGLQSAVPDLRGAAQKWPPEGTTMDILGRRGCTGGDADNILSHVLPEDFLLLEQHTMSNAVRALITTASRSMKLLQKKLTKASQSIRIAGGGVGPMMASRASTPAFSARNSYEALAPLGNSNIDLASPHMPRFHRLSGKNPATSSSSSAMTALHISVCASHCCLPIDEYSVSPVAEEIIRGVQGVVVPTTADRRGSAVQKKQRVGRREVQAADENEEEEDMYGGIRGVERAAGNSPQSQGTSRGKVVNILQSPVFRHDRKRAGNGDSMSSFLATYFPTYTRRIRGATERRHLREIQGRRKKSVPLPPDGRTAGDISRGIASEGTLVIKILCTLVYTGAASMSSKLPTRRNSFARSVRAEDVGSRGDIGNDDDGAASVADFLHDEFITGLLEAENITMANKGDRIFEFDPDDLQPEGEGGSGLSMSVARGVVELHGGSVSVHSATQKDEASGSISYTTTFVVTLPMYRRSEGAASDANATTNSSKTGGRTLADRAEQIFGRRIHDNNTSLLTQNHSSNHPRTWAFRSTAGGHSTGAFRGTLGGSSKSSSILPEGQRPYHGVQGAAVQGGRSVSAPNSARSSIPGLLNRLHLGGGRSASVTPRVSISNLQLTMFQSPKPTPVASRRGSGRGYQGGYNRHLLSNPNHHVIGHSSSGSGSQDAKSSGDSNDRYNFERVSSRRLVSHRNNNGGVSPAPLLGSVRADARLNGIQEEDRGSTNGVMLRRSSTTMFGMFRQQAFSFSAAASASALSSDHLPSLRTPGASNAPTPVARVAGPLVPPLPSDDELRRNQNSSSSSSMVMMEGSLRQRLMHPHTKSSFRGDLSVVENQGDPWGLGGHDIVAAAAFQQPRGPRSLDDERLLADVLGSSSSGSKPGSTFSSQSQIDGLTAGSLVPMGAAGGASSAVAKGSTLRGAGGGRPQLKPTGGEDFVDDVLDDVLVGATGAPHSTERTLAVRQHAPGFPASDSSHRRRYLTVLIVDDSELTRKMMRRVLEAAGHICDEAEDGIDAISKFKMSFALDRRYHPQHARRTINLIKRSSTGSVSASFTSTGGIHGGTLRHSFTAQLSSIQEALEGEASPECSANDDSGAGFRGAGLDNPLGELQLHSCYDVILMDFIMPNMDGPTATRELRRLGYEGLILGVTGNALPTDIDHFLAHGASKVLLKPFRIKEFNEAISVEAARGNQGTNGSGGISTPSPLSTPTMQLV